MGDTSVKTESGSLVSLGCRSDQAELVALGISENLPSVSHIDVISRRSSESLGARDSAVEVSDTEVHVHAVFHRLFAGHSQEEKRDGIRVESDVAVFIGAHGATQKLLPPLR